MSDIVNRFIIEHCVHKTGKQIKRYVGLKAQILKDYYVEGNYAILIELLNLLR